MKFNINEINSVIVRKLALEQATRLWESEGAITEGRTFKNVFDDCVRGQYAENFLIEKCKYTNHNYIYGDVRDCNGNPVEVKVTYPGNANTIRHKCNYAKSHMKEKYANILLIFENERGNPIYKLYGQYEWNNDHQRFYMKEDYETIPKNS